MGSKRDLGSSRLAHLCKASTGDPVRNGWLVGWFEVFGHLWYQLSRRVYCFDNQSLRVRGHSLSIRPSNTMVNLFKNLLSHNVRSTQDLRLFFLPPTLPFGYPTIWNEHRFLAVPHTRKQHPHSKWCYRPLARLHYEVASLSSRRLTSL